MSFQTSNLEIPGPIQQVLPRNLEPKEAQTTIDNCNVSENPQAQGFQVEIISIDRSKLCFHSFRTHTSSRNLTPMERWNDEVDTQKSWHALASFTRDANWKECTGQQQSASMKREVVSVGSKA